MARLVLTEDCARAVIRASEGREPGPGHTVANHVDISNKALRERIEFYEPNGKLKVVTAFVSIQQCARMLSQAVVVLGESEFIRNFNNIKEGQERDFRKVRLPAAEKVRYCWGDQRIVTDEVDLVVRKMSARPYGLHVLTFYPRIAAHA